MKKGVEIAKQVLAKGWDAFDFKTMAPYEAELGNTPPTFKNIISRNPGEAMGYVAFHHFLDTVGEGNIFISTLPTESGGSAMFDRLKEKGILEEIDRESARKQGIEFRGLYICCYKITKNPMQALEEWVNEQEQQQEVGVGTKAETDKRSTTLPDTTIDQTEHLIALATASGRIKK